MFVEWSRGADMKKIIVFSVALLISAATYAYSLPLMHHGIEQGVYSGRVGDIGQAGQGFNLIPLPNFNTFPSPTFEDTSNFTLRRHIAGAGMSFVPEFSQHHGNDVGGTDPIPEPATIMLFGTGLIGLACMGRRRMRKK
ncbi:MAG: PEP-CTERM sorting domain-containing protein [Deltaproteobacteria bacterium]|nr:PEP-CTERM sorting domain-containing protein [Deltaproteobacteria bacterium]